MSQNKLQSTVISNDTPLDVSVNNLNIKDVIQSTNDGVGDKRIKPVPFWSENPNILFQQKYIFEFFPVDFMTYEQKLNAVSRTVIILTIVGFLLSKNVSTLVVGIITLAAIFILYYYHTKEIEKFESKKSIQDIKEGFENPAQNFLNINNLPTDPNIFAKSSPNNPFSNVMMTDYDFNPLKKPAPPSFNTDINNEIMNNTKQLVNDINSDQPNISDKLYKDLGDQLEFEQSMRQFNSNPATTIPNDQQSFAEFCYGSMVSAKEGNLFSLTRNLANYNLY
jgi:hypothetical protein